MASELSAAEERIWISQLSREVFGTSQQSVSRSTLTTAVISFLPASPHVLPVDSRPPEQLAHELYSMANNVSTSSSRKGVVSGFVYSLSRFGRYRSSGA